MNLLDFQIQSANSRTAEATDIVIKRLKDALERAERYAADINDQEVSLKLRSDRAGFLLHDLTSNLMGSLRIDLLAMAQRDLYAAAEGEQA